MSLLISHFAKVFQMWQYQICNTLLISHFLVRVWHNHVCICNFKSKSKSSDTPHWHKHARIPDQLRLCSRFPWNQVARTPCKDHTTPKTICSKSGIIWMAGEVHVREGTVNRYTWWKYQPEGGMCKLHYTWYGRTTQNQHRSQNQHYVPHAYIRCFQMYACGT